MYAPAAVVVPDAYRGTIDLVGDHLHVRERGAGGSSDDTGDRRTEGELRVDAGDAGGRANRDRSRSLPKALASSNHSLMYPSDEASNWTLWLPAPSPWIT